MTVKALYPTIEPSLELDFANTKALDPRISFTRASTGTCVGADGLIKTAGNNVPRFDHNPTTGESLGLLVEEARTNYIYSSNPVNTTNWGPAATFTATSTTTPDGTSINSLSNNPRSVNVNIGAVAKTLSFFVKADTVTTGSFQTVGGGWGAEAGTYSFDLTAQTFSGGTVQPVGNGWFRLSITFGTTSSGTLGNIFNCSGLFLWGAQFEAGSFPTSYIPTVAATVTRAADVASMTGTNFSSWYNTTTGTWLGTMSATAKGFRLLETRGPGGGDMSVSIRPDTANTRCAFAGDTSGAVFVTYSGSPVKIGAGYGSGSIRGVANGTLANLVTTGNHSSSTLLNIGTYPAENLYLNGTIARIAYYPVRLPDAQLQALTAT